MKVINSIRPALTNTLQVLSTTQYVMDWMQNLDEARVLHVFEHACNLINIEGETISIVNTIIGNGPFNVLIPTINFREFLDENSTIRINKSVISLGVLDISLSRAILWQPKPDWESLRERSSNLSASIIPIEELLAEESPADSFARVLLPSSISHEIPMKIFEVVQETFSW
ncbi:MAG: hypothetical protein IH859_06925, partial [Chloroflexi bacterium]|nr:hypothetical protein [Chloroflexota bacterium]